MELLAERIRIAETFRPDVIRVRLRQRAQCDLAPRVRTGDPGGAANDYHGIADETVGSVMHPKCKVEVRQIGHVILGKLLLNRSQEGSERCPILFDIPSEGAHAECRAETAPQLFVLPQHFQTTLQT